MLCDGFGAAWPLSRKFGCTPDLAGQLLLARPLGGLARPACRSTWVRSSSTPAAWDRALAWSPTSVRSCGAEGVELELVNLGGGLPGTYIEAMPSIDQYGDAIVAAVDRRLGPTLPAEVLIEPGRHLVADAGALRCEVVTVGRKSVSDVHRWVYLDIGMFSGLAEVMVRPSGTGSLSDRPNAPERSGRAGRTDAATAPTSSTRRSTTSSRSTSSR